MSIAFGPNVRLFDPKSGLMTREGFQFLNSLNQALTEATSDYVRVDASQTLTNKTIDGDANTLRDINTSQIKASSKTGDDTRLVTGTAGSSGTLLQWDSAGNAVSSGAAIGDYLTSVAAGLTYLSVASAEMIYLPLAGGLLTGPVRLPTYTVAGVPDAATYITGLIYVSNETGGATPAFSDGTNWRRVSDRAIVA